MPTTNPTPIAERVALALCQASQLVGSATKFDMSKGGFEPPATRAQNLLRKRGEYAYVEAGDPCGWGDGALATIFMEPHGGRDDCLTLDYYGEFGFDASEICAKASDALGDVVIEFHNAAVALVWPS